MKSLFSFNYNLFVPEFVMIFGDTYPALVNEFFYRYGITVNSGAQVLAYHIILLSIELSTHYTHLHTN
jgi:hypothetical protein